MMKKLLSLLLALLLLFSLSACGTNSDLESDLSELEELLGGYVEQEDEILDDFVPLETLSPEGETTQLPSDSQDTATETPETTDSQDSTTDIVEFVTSETTESPLPTEENELPIDFIETPTTEYRIPEDGTYTTKEDVALYIHTYGKLPKNFITKNEARKLGWEGGSLEPYAPGMCIGGDYFGNYEGLLPTDRKYTECDIDTLGARSRGAKRIVFSKDGLIYYTDDHYESFTLLYGEE